jgi:hypothetical protein
MFANCYLATVAYENHQYIPILIDRFPELIIYDASVKNPYAGPGKIIKIPNKGFTSNWNLIFEDFLKTDKEYIWMTNNDIDIEQSTLHRMIDVIKIHTEAAAVVASYNSHHQPLRNHSKGIRPVPFMEQTSPIYRKSAIKNLKETHGYVLYPPIKMGWGVDLISSYHLRELGWALLVIDDVSFHHYIAENAKAEYGSKKEYAKKASTDRGSNIRNLLGQGYKKKLLEGLEQYNYKI